MEAVNRDRDRVQLRSQEVSGQSRLKNILVAKLVGWLPALGRLLAAGYKPESISGVIPWNDFVKPLDECRVALVTTAGIHHKSQQPFDMQDVDGDPTYRELNGSAPWDDFTITHDYYDHTNAGKDPNIILPLDRLREFAGEGMIGSLAQKHYSFMGHIVGRHLDSLVEKTAVEIAGRLKADGVDLVILSPG